MDDLHRRKRGENLMITLENKITSLGDKIDFYYVNGNMKKGFLYSREQHLLERSLFEE